MSWPAATSATTTPPATSRQHDWHVGIVTGGVDPLGFGLGCSWVGVGVEIFYPANDPYPDARSCGFSTYLNSWKSVGGD